MMSKNQRALTVNEKPELRYFPNMNYKEVSSILVASFKALINITLYKVNCTECLPKKSTIANFKVP